MQSPAGRTAAAVIALTVLLGVVALASTEQATSPAPAPPPVEEPAPTPPQSGEQPPPPEPLAPLDAEAEEPPGEGVSLPWLPWLLFLLVALGVLAGVVMFLRARRAGARRRPRRARPEEDEDAAPDVRAEEAEATRRAVDAALPALRDPADPRAAVIEAYARMEEALAERALRRGDAEAPREYLERVLRERGMPQESLTTLTALFEEARFSRHPIPESAPRRAMSELYAARAKLGA